MVEKMRRSKPRKMKNTESLNPASSSLFASSSFGFRGEMGILREKQNRESRIEALGMDSHRE